MSGWFSWVLTAAALVGLVLAAHRHTELFVLRAKDGKTTFVRGRIPPRLLREMQDVLHRAHASGRVVARVVRGEAELATHGSISEPTAQQLRNVMGQFPLARIRSGRRARR